MMVSSAARWRGIAAAAVLVGAVAVVRLHRAATAARDELAELAPDPAAVHYRYSIDPASDAEAQATDAIAALEARVQAMPSPFDDAELAELYFRRAQRDGDPADYPLAEARARRSLDALASPNPAVLTLAKLADARHDFRAAIELTHRHKGRSIGDWRGWSYDCGVKRVARSGELPSQLRDLGASLWRERAGDAEGRGASA